MIALIAKLKLLPSFDRLERDRKANLQTLLAKAKLMKLDGFESITWADDIWLVTGGRLVKLTGNNTSSAFFHFLLPPKLNSEALKGGWEGVAKSLFILRFHRKNQSTPNQRNFLTAIGYVSHAASQSGQDLHKLTPEALDNACALISKHYSETTAYNLHKHVAEFASHCDANGLCKVLLQYKFSRMKRPASVGGINHKRLDEPEVTETKLDKLVDPAVFKIIGELYLTVPSDHKYRFYILMLTLLACTGRRFSEISLLPLQEVSSDEDKNSFIQYFPRKASRGDLFTPKRKLYLPSEVAPIVGNVLSELAGLIAEARSTAEEMHRSKGPDLRFLKNLSKQKKLYVEDLQEIGVSHSAIATTGWLRKAGLVWQDCDRVTKQGRKSHHPMCYTNKEAVKTYCFRDFSETSLRPFHTDQFGKEYYLKDLLFIRLLGLCTGSYAHWLAPISVHHLPPLFSRSCRRIRLEQYRG